MLAWITDTIALAGGLVLLVLLELVVLLAVHIVKEVRR